MEDLMIVKIVHDRVFLNDVEIRNINSYKLENSANSESAKLTISLYVSTNLISGE